MPRRAPEMHTLQRHDDMRTLDYIERYQAEQGRSPSQRQIWRGLQISAPSVAHHSVHRLVRAGLLQVQAGDKGLAGEMVITPVGRERLQQWRTQAAQPSAGVIVTESAASSLRGAA